MKKATIKLGKAQLSVDKEMLDNASKMTQKTFYELYGKGIWEDDSAFTTTGNLMRSIKK